MEELKEANTEANEEVTVRKEKQKVAKELSTASKQIKDKKEKKKEKKEKETSYAHLGEETSDEEGINEKQHSYYVAKIKKSKGFIFSSSKKEKKSENSMEADEGRKIRKKKEIGSKLLMIKSLNSISNHPLTKDQPPKVLEELPIFGVPLELAVERDRCHDGVQLPSMVRLCIDYIEEQGLMVEGIYRSSGVKSKVNKLRRLFNCHLSVNLNDYEPTVVASTLKQFLRELPLPVLTTELVTRFENVSLYPQPHQRLEGMKQLLSILPECNRLLLAWIIIHMNKVIERERFNKMTIQNAFIVLGPTMKISHKVLNCFFENVQNLFDKSQIVKYIPPITSEYSRGELCATPKNIQTEIMKQESLLAFLHSQITKGSTSKSMEEQIWEHQRIITQLKRKQRLGKKQQSVVVQRKPMFEPIEYDEVIDFKLQTSIDDDNDDETDCAVAKPLDKNSEKMTFNHERQNSFEIKIINGNSGEIETGRKNSRVTVVTLNAEENSSAIPPLLPPPPSFGKTRINTDNLQQPTTTNNNLQTKQDKEHFHLDNKKNNNTENIKLQSSSLPRGLLPLSELKSIKEFSCQTQSELLLLEHELRCVLIEQEELLSLQGELEQRKISEQQEIAELCEEIATMQTLYSYRVCSVNSSSSSDYNIEEDDMVDYDIVDQSEEDELDCSKIKDDCNADELYKILCQLMRENEELETKRALLCNKMQEERQKCVYLRIQIRLEQERLKNIY